VRAALAINVLLIGARVRITRDQPRGQNKLLNHREILLEYNTREFHL
jgi:hypothetical protein